jgi:hypothetical protein
MIKLAALFAAASALAAAACGPSEPAKSADPPPSAEHGHDGDGAHEAGGERHEGEALGKHGPMGGAVKSFHDVLAPVYHAQKNADRDAKACGAVPSFKERGNAIGAEVGADAKKKTAADGLTSAIGDLERACAESGRAQVDPKLEKLHDAFHAVMEAK